MFHSRRDCLRVVFIFIALALLSGAMCTATGCGSGSQRIVRAHWLPDSDGVIRVTFRFPTPELATNINPADPLPRSEVSQATEAFKAAVRTALQGWEAAAQAEGINLRFIEVAPEDTSAKVDWILARLPSRYAAKYFPWHRNLSTGEIGRMVVKVRPDLAPELLPGTVAHEAGHTIGLGELDNKRALMNPSRPTATITGSDTAELVRHYPPFDIL